MDKISISNILGIPEENVIGNFGSNIITNQKKKSIKSEVNEIIQKNTKRREDKLNLYRQYLRNCIKQIKYENQYQKTEIFFKVDGIIYGHPEYDRDECIEYLLIELMKYHFDVYQVDENRIFISWKYTELHKKST